MTLFGENLVLRFLGQKEAKMRFFKRYEKLVLRRFLIFWMKLQH